MNGISRAASQARRLALIGGVVGLVPAVGLGLLRTVLEEPPERREQLFGNAVFALVYVSPYLLVLVLSRSRDAAARGGLLMALGLLSLVASLSSFSLVTAVLLPATATVLVAAWWSLRAAHKAARPAVSFFLAGMMGAAVIGLSFYSLFGLEEDESRCWVFTGGAGGSQEWQARPNVGGSGRLSAGTTGPRVTRSLCVSDVITNREAAVGLGVLVAGVLSLIGVSRAIKPAPA